MADERERNANEIESEIEQLERDYGSSILDLLDIWADDTDYKAFWAGVREVNAMFKAMPLHRDKREELWERLSRLCEDVKGKHHSQQQQRTYELDRNRDTVLQAILNLKHVHGLGAIGHWGGPDLKGFWSNAKELSDLFRETKPMRSSDREELWEDFQNVCDHVKELQEEKHEEWRARNEEHLERWRALIDKNEDMIERLKGQIDHCESIRDNAYTEDHAGEVQGWIDEKERIIDDIESRNAELWEKIRDVEDRLRG
jgi:hypothetical protein